MTVIRIATEEDEQRNELNIDNESKFFDICEGKINEHGLNMKLVRVKCLFDGNKIIFYFTAETRVDFRSLVKDLASIFKTSIELRQVGSRDEARLVGGLGICGHNLCCSKTLPEFAPVSIKMAKEQNLPYVTCWGDGSPLREFLYVDDLANLCVFLMNNYSGNETVNAGTGKELTIKELTELVAKVIGYTGEIRWDASKPNGTPRKLLDVSKATKLGWTYKTELEDGIRLSYEDFLNNPMRAER